MIKPPREDAEPAMPFAIQVPTPVGQNETDDEGDERHEWNDVADNSVNTVATCLVEGANDTADATADLD